MSRSLVFRRKARRDILEAKDWYDTLSPTIGDAFVQEIERISAVVQDNPEQYQKIHGGVRRAPLRGFPYGLFYLFSATEIFIMRCLHNRRNPTLWPDEDS